MNKIRLVFVIMLVLSLLIGLTGRVTAQNGCKAVIVDETGTLDQAKLCQAAGSLIEKGLEVHIYYTNKSFSDRGAWLDHLTSVETSQGVYYGNDTWMDTLLMFEARTDAGDTFITVGDVLYDTLKDHGTPIKAEITQGIRNGDPTGGFIAAMKVVYDIAYPVPPTPAPTATLGPTATTGPTATPAPTATPLPPLITKEQGEQLVNVLLWLFGLAVVGGIGFAFYVWVYVPWDKKQKRIAALIAQGNLFRDRILEYKALSNEMFVTRGKLNLLMNWRLHGGERFVKENQQVQKAAVDAKAAIDTLTQLMDQIPDPLPHDLDTLPNLVAGLESAYILIVGRDVKMLSLTKREVDQLMDPTSVLEDDPSGELSQIAQGILRQVEGGELKVTMMFDHSREARAKTSILEVVRSIKDLIRRVRDAEKSVPPKLAAAHELRAQVGETQLPFGVKTSELYGVVDRQLVEADQAVKNQQWFEAERLETSITQALKSIQTILPEFTQVRTSIEGITVPSRKNIPARETVVNPIEKVYTAAIGYLIEYMFVEAADKLKEVSRNVKRVQTLLNDYETALQNSIDRLQKVADYEEQGFSAPVDTDRAEIALDICMVQQAIGAGDYGKAEEFSRELEGDSARALKTYEDLEKVYDQVNTGLVELSNGVAVQQKKADCEAGKSWTTLKSYPLSNRQTVEGLYDAAVATLADLFDKPEDAKDRASTINSLNQTKQQANVWQAEKLLKQAFVELQLASTKLTNIVAQLVVVQKAEAAVGQGVTQVEAAYAQALGYVKTNDPKIDVEVDGLLGLAKDCIEAAKKQIAAREFTLASASLNDAQANVKRADDSAKQQVSSIVSLLDQLNSTKSGVTAAVSKVQQRYAYMTPAARKATTGATVDESLSSLKKAQQREATFASLQDRQLSKAITEAISLYNQAQNSTNDANRRMDRDLDEYRGYIRDAESAISSANSAISSAVMYTSHSDSGSAGDYSLSKARSSIPDSPHDGETIEEIRRKQRQAEEASNYARQAASEAQSHIREVEAERRRLAELEQQRQEAERQRQLAEQRARENRERQEQADRDRRNRETLSRIGGSGGGHFGGSGGGRIGGGGGGRI